VQTGSNTATFRQRKEGIGMKLRSAKSRSTDVRAAIVSSILFPDHQHHFHQIALIAHYIHKPETFPAHKDGDIRFFDSLFLSL
jgi:hypothetical protein